MSGQRPHIKIPKAWIEKFCTEHHILKMSLFGSVLSDRFTSASDIELAKKGGFSGLKKCFDYQIPKKHTFLPVLQLPPSHSIF
jgi:predicted nucleotidyltransferase